MYERKCGRTHVGPCIEETRPFDAIIQIRDVLTSRVQHGSILLTGTPSDWAEALLLIDDILAKEGRQAYTGEARAALFEAMGQDWRS